MKKYLILLASLILASTISAKNSNTSDSWKENWRHTNFINLYYSGGALKVDMDEGVVGSQEERDKFKSKFGMGFSIGRSFLIGRPIKDVLRFGVEATWLDFNSDLYQGNRTTSEGNKEIRYNKTDIAIGVGPTIIYQPVDRLRIKVYGQIQPAMTILTSRTHKDGEDRFDDKETAHVTFQGIGTAGLCVSYRWIGLGFEGRWCSIDGISFATMSVFSGRNPGYRAYLNFNF